jgi:REP-associated tyrosine transposase
VPRSPRVFVADGIYHIASRGSDRQPLFRFDADRLAFLERLAAVVERYELACVAYCLMGNHYHLLVQTPDERVSNALRELNGGYARHFNRVHGRSAHLFRNRFFARQIEEEAYLLTACRYLAYNPIRAGLCREPGDWPWSSHRATAGLDPSPGFLSEALIRDACGGQRNWRLRYRDLVAEPSPATLEDGLRSRPGHHLTARGV